MCGGGGFVKVNKSNMLLFLCLQYIVSSNFIKIGGMLMMQIVCKRGAYIWLNMGWGQQVRSK